MQMGGGDRDNVFISWWSRVSLGDVVLYGGRGV